jgi:hypothetical protein
MNKRAGFNDRYPLNRENAMPSICHFEIPADDPQRAKKFYENLFGWEIRYHEEMDYYVVATDKEGKTVHGGMMKRQQKGQPIINYIDVENLDESAEKIKELGGQVVVGKTPIPELGWFCICLDSEKNLFGLWQGDKTAA